jgi:CRISPR-associated protein Cas5h
MKKLIVFDLKGNFAHFNNSLSFPKYLKHTYYIPPKTTILGLLGSLIGLKGYGFKGSSVEFLDKLSDIRLYIKINNKNLNKMMIKYNSISSFVNNGSSLADRKNPNIIMSEEILCNPNYEIGLVLDEENKYHSKIINNIKNNISKFHIYLGKNEFFANIVYKGIFNFNYVDLNNMEITDKTILDSIFPISEDTVVSGQFVTYFASSFDSKLRYLHKKVVFNHKMGLLKLKENISLKKENLISVDNKIYYLF